MHPLSSVMSSSFERIPPSRICSTTRNSLYPTISTPRLRPNWTVYCAITRSLDCFPTTTPLGWPEWPSPATPPSSRYIGTCATCNSCNTHLFVLTVSASHNNYTLFRFSFPAFTSNKPLTIHQTTNKPSNHVHYATLHYTVLHCTVLHPWGRFIQ